MAGGPRFSEDEIELLAVLKANNCTVDQIHQRHQKEFADIPRSHTSINNKLSKPDVRERIAWHRKNPQTPQVTPLWDGPMVDPDKLWEEAKKRSERSKSYASQRHQAKIEVPGNLPVGLSFISDQHIGDGKATWFQRLEDDARLIADTPGLYAVLGGDGVDNAIKHKASVVGSGSKPSDEYRLFEHYLGLFDGSILAGCTGNHDDWTKDLTDLDNMGRLYRENRIFGAPDFVVLECIVGGVSYTVKVRHQYKYNSTLNQTNSIKRMWEQDGDNFDIGVLCHLHEPAMEPFIKHRQVRWAFRPGSYQYTTTYTRRHHASYGSTPTCPTAILFPGEKRIVGFWDVGDAASYLEYLRNG